MARVDRATQRRLRWVILFGAAVVVSLAIPPVRGALGSVFAAMAAPVSSATDGLGSWFGSIGANSDLRAERDRLAQTHAELVSRLAEAEQRLDAVSALRTLEEFTRASQHRSVQAPVIGYSPDPGIKSLVIGRGSRHGIQPGMSVIAGPGILIGKIKTADETSATVLLIQDSQSRVLAKVQNAAKSPGVLKGERGIGLHMELIPKNDAVDVGSVVVTSGTEPRVPPDLVIGSIAKTTARSGELFQTAEIISPIQGYGERAVAVILN